MKIPTLAIVSTLFLAGCVQGVDVDEAPRQLGTAENIRLDNWTDQELIGQVNANITEPNGPMLSINPLPLRQDVGPITINGTTDRLAAVFVAILAWEPFCERENEVEWSSRIIANGSWSYTFDDPGMGSYSIFSYAFGMKSHSELDRTVSNAGFVDSVSIQLNWPATVRIDYGELSDQEPVNETVYMSHKSAWVWYQEEQGDDDEAPCPNNSHPGYVNVHDVMEQWAEDFEHKVSYEYSPSLNGYFVQSIDEVGNPASSEAPPWWCYSVNGETDGVTGPSLQRVNPEDVISWQFGSCTGAENTG